MSDSVKKWHEMQEEKKFSFIDAQKKFDAIEDKPSLTDLMKSQAYSILVTYQEESILEAARILNLSRKADGEKNLDI